MGEEVHVISKKGDLLYPCSKNKASKLVDKRHAEWLGDNYNSIVLIMTTDRKIEIRHEVLERDDYICQYCGKELNEDNATIDHVVPKSKGGSYYPTNLVCSCKSCNVKKGDKMPQNFNPRRDC